MPLRRFRRQYEQLSQFERRRIIDMMETGWSARRVARQLGRSDCVAAIQATIHPSLGPPVSSRNIGRRLAEEHLASRHPLRVLPLRRPPLDTSVWSGATHEETVLCNGMEPGRL
ncbi:uncharacterized protein TNCV_425471 [Trichonephila clavipes]|nr:uncharacterized protein TNCV_425471 [Trichonephila clavipes]